MGWYEWLRFKYNLTRIEINCYNSDSHAKFANSNQNIYDILYPTEMWLTSEVITSAKLVPAWHQVGVDEQIIIILNTEKLWLK